MRVYKETPFEFGYLPWQVRPPTPSLMVLVKGTFDLVHDGVATVAEEQQLTTGPVHWDDDAALSLKVDSDFAVLKPRAECFFTGSAYAPGGVATGSLLAGFRVGAVTRSLAVFGDRVWDGVGAMTPPTPFVSMPLRWERAFGGAGVAANPLGAGLAAVEREGRRVVPLPNLEDPSDPVTGPRDRPAPVCFAPLHPGWAARLRRTGTYDERWRLTRWPWFPDDFDYGYFNAAPAPQQIEGFWRGDEAVGLHNLHPRVPELRSKLPGLRARCFAEVDRGAGVEFVEVGLRLDTITLDGDAGQAVCVWRGMLEGVGEKLAEVLSFFFLHEPLETALPLAHYAAWLARKKQEAVAEEEEFEPEAPPAELAEVAPVVPPVDALGALLASLRLGPGAGEDPVGHAALLAQVEAVVKGPPDPPPPLPSAVRAGLVGAGMEVPPELAALPDEEAPPEEGPADGDAAQGALGRAEVLHHRAYELPLVGMDLTGADLSELDLTGQDLSGCILAGARLYRSVLVEAVLAGAVLSDAVLTEADLSRAVLTEADLTGAVADGVDAQEADFTGALAERSVWTGSRFAKAKLVGAELMGATLTACDFRGAVLDTADLEGAQAERAHFEDASLVDATLEGGRFAGAVFDRAVMTGLRASEGADFQGCSLREVDGVQARFEGSDLRGAFAGGANLEKSECTGARWDGADLVAARLRGASFQEASLVGAVLLRADALEASFEGADLTRADLRGANLTSAQLWRARTDGTQWELALLHRTLRDPALG